MPQPVSKVSVIRQCVKMCAKSGTKKRMTNSDKVFCTLGESHGATCSGVIFRQDAPTSSTVQRHDMAAKIFAPCLASTPFVPHQNDRHHLNGCWKSFASFPRNRCRGDHNVELLGSHKSTDKRENAVGTVQEGRCHKYCRKNFLGKTQHSGTDTPANSLGNTSEDKAKSGQYGESMSRIRQPQLTDKSVLVHPRDSARILSCSETETSRLRAPRSRTTERLAVLCHRDVSSNGLKPWHSICRIRNLSVKTYPPGSYQFLQHNVFVQLVGAGAPHWITCVQQDLKP